MESCLPFLPRASSLPAGFIDNNDDGLPPPTTVLAGNISEAGDGERSKKPNRSFNFSQELKGEPSRSKISKAILWHQGDRFSNSPGFWQDEQAKKTGSTGIIERCYCSSDERSRSSSASSDFFEEWDKLKYVRGDQLSFDSDGKSSEFSSDFLQENSWVDDLLQLYSSYDDRRDGCLKAKPGKEQFLYMHGTAKEDNFTMNYGDCFRKHKMDGFLRINRVTETCEYELQKMVNTLHGINEDNKVTETCEYELQKMVNTLHDLKKDNDESLMELFRRGIELDCKWSKLLYEREVLKLHFARANNQKDTLTLLCQAVQARAQCITENNNLPQARRVIQPETLISRMCREHQNLSGIGKYKFDLPQVNHIL